MELNKKTKGNKEYTTNPEGSIVYERLPEIQLYLEASNLKIKEDSFYVSAKDKLGSVVKLSNDLDNQYVMGLAQFLADKGLKLSPVVLLSILSGKHYSFNNSNVDYIFNTPRRMSESIALQSLSITHLNNSFKKHVLKKALENMSENTLRKNRMRSKKIKLSDLIKLLRPHPKDERMAAFYKKIIENSKETKLDEKRDFLAVKSSTKIEETVKKDIIYEQVMSGRVSPNMLIRNLQFLAKNYDFRKQSGLQEKVIETLNKVQDYRFLNIFDVVQAAVYVHQFEKALFEVVKRFVLDAKKTFDFPEESTLLFDVSGSMDGDGLNNGFRYLAVLSMLFPKMKIRFFSDALAPENKDHQKMIADLQKGCYKDARNTLDIIYKMYSGGTSLIDSTEKLLDEAPIKNLIIISDEVSWVEGEDLRNSIDRLSKSLSQINFVLINPSVSKGTVFGGNVLGISSLTSSILLDFALATNPAGFVKYIKNYKHTNDDHGKDKKK